MGIEMIEQKNDEQLIEYKLPDFINEAGNNFGSNSDDYEVLQVLGGGGFSKVLKVKSKSNFGIYAMKKVDMAHIMDDQGLNQKYFENEILFLKNLNHPNIIKCYNIFQENQYLYFIMEFMNNGDLESFNEAMVKMKMKIPEPKLWEIFYKCLSGLDYIHKEKIVHRDIKLQNLFLDDNFNVKIGDFNISAVTDEEAAKKFGNNINQVMNLMNEHTTLGTRGYQAPEIGVRQYGQKVDIFSMGASFYELCYGHVPSKMKRVEKDEGFYSKELKDFVKRMIDSDETKRPTCNEAMVDAKNYFIKLYVKNTSVEAILNCFSNYPNFNNYFSDNSIINIICDLNKEISKICFSVIQSMKCNNILQIKADLYEMRKILEKEGIDIKSDNKEINPGNFLIFFLRKLNSELNEILAPNTNISEQEKIRRFKILSKQNSFSPNEEENTFNLIIDTYNKKILSLISRNFFSYIKIKRTCLFCNHTSCYFDKLFFIPININIAKQKIGIFCNITLKNAIDTLKNSIINNNQNKGIICKGCNNVCEFKETKNFYHTAKNLIIIFDRGENMENNSYIDFDDELRLNSSEVERYNEVHYQLTGIITKIKEEYISFIRQNNNIWISSKGEQYNFNNVKKCGIVIALFYYSNEDILIIESKQLQNNVQQNMPNPQNFMNNNNNVFQYQNQNNQNNLMNNNCQTNFIPMNNNQQFMDGSRNNLQQTNNNIPNNNIPNNNIPNNNVNMPNFINMNTSINNNIGQNANNIGYQNNNNNMFNNNFPQNPFFNQNNSNKNIDTRLVLNNMIKNNYNNMNNFPNWNNQFVNFQGNNNNINQYQQFNNYEYK